MPDDARVPRGWPDGFGLGPDERRALLILSSLRGIGPRRLRALAWKARSAGACVAAIRNGEAGSGADRQAASRADHEAIAREVADADARMLGPREPAYPEELLDLFDPPAAIFVRGASLAPGTTRVAVVGARSASPLGLEAAGSIARGLSARGVDVVSGAARGIDRASHEGALESRGRTVAVLGCGIDRHAKPQGRSLIARIRVGGTVVSEYPPGVPAAPYRFPARNRIIAALAQAVVVVEGRRTSGSMITARHALDLGRAVYAVPGAITNRLAEGPHALIRDGATLLRDADDLLADLGIEPGTLVRSIATPEPGTLEAQALCLVETPTLPERAARQLGVSVPRLVAAMMRLEMSRLVLGIGGRFERTVAGAEVARRLEGSEDARGGETPDRPPGTTPPAA